MGAISNQLKVFMEQALDEKALSFASDKPVQGIDVTLPGRVFKRGSIHVINQVMGEIEDIFGNLGFTIASGPEVEDDYHNFEALNIPENHPARDMQDTFYFNKGVLLRTHTSPVQIRVMESPGPAGAHHCAGKGLPVRLRCQPQPHVPPGGGALGGRGHHLRHFKGVLYDVHPYLVRAGYTSCASGPRSSPSPNRPPRWTWAACICGAGCRVCKNTGWLEILGCGMVDPEVYRFVGIDPEKVHGVRLRHGRRACRHAQVQH